MTGEFVGRERELATITTLLLDSARLVTLVGAGGIGKTRLATEAVRRFCRARPVPVYWVRLAQLFSGAGAGAVEEEIAQAVVESDFSERSAWEIVVDTLGGSPASGRRSQAILVMDNCEHVGAGVGAVITELLSALPGLTVLATSRQAIGWVDEQLLRVPPLESDQALTLFLLRATLAGHAIVDDDQLTMAASICRRVDNHPLYLRLAAARLQWQPLRMILRDLSGDADDRRLGWSHGPTVGAEERHRGVRDVIAWSFDLCTDSERLLLERMSVFAAGYDDGHDQAGLPRRDVGVDAEAIEAVCSDPDVGTAQTTIAAHEVDGLVERLVDQSLVSIHLTENTVRYSLLESVRVFAQRQLRERLGPAESERLAARHRRYYRDKTAYAQAEWFGPAELELLEWAHAAWDNLRRAIDGSLGSADHAVIGMQIAAGLMGLRVLMFRASLREGRQWIERTLAATCHLDSAPVELQVTVRSQLAWLLLCQGMTDDAERVLDECVATCVADPAVRATWRDDPGVDLGLPAPVELSWGVELMLARSDPRSIHTLGRAREKFAAQGNRGGAAFSEMFEALAAAFLGTETQALGVARRHLDNATAAGALWAQSWAELAVAIAHTEHGDLADALAIGRSALSRQLAMRDRWGTVWAVHIRAWTLARLCTIALAQGDQRDRARALGQEIARLLGGAAALRAQLGVKLANLGPFGAETERAIAVARTALGHKAYDEAEREGAMMRPERNEAGRFAMGTVSFDDIALDHPARGGRASRWHELSAAEREVSILAAAGWTNTAIAARRGSSCRTVDAQMTAVFQKLTITARSEIAALIPADQRHRVEHESARRPPRATTPRQP